MENRPFSPEQPENKVEYGKNAEIVLKFIRHGERDKEGNLLDYGREVTKQRAIESGIQPTEVNAVKAIGSPAGPVGETGMQRSLETAHIYAHEIAGDEAFKTRAEKVLSYETYVNPSPYNHTEVYNSFLPEDYDSLDDEAKATAAAVAQSETVNHLINLDTPEARAYKQEIAGSYAYVIDHYQRVAKRLNEDSKVLMPAGTHGGLMEFLLEEALVRTDKEGNQVRGFRNLEEIGGAFMPSEAFNVDIATDENGNNKQLVVTFDNSSRPAASEMYLDETRLRELRNYYQKLHSESTEQS